MGNRLAKAPLLMDSAYEGEENRQQAKSGGVAVVPPLKSRKNPIIKFLSEHAQPSSGKK